jgi:hypothetical protein
VLDYLLGRVSPLVGVEKSPENSSREDYFRRLLAAYPRARFLHLTRHPVPSVLSMHRVWADRGFWTLPAELFHQFCLGVWYFQHTRITRHLATLPPDRALQVRSEDVLNRPRHVLPVLCRWLGVDPSGSAIEPMLFPERSPFARPGPEGAVGGGDAGFLAEPHRRQAECPPSLELPPEWIVDPWLALSALELARRLGYGPSG